MSSGEVFSNLVITWVALAAIGNFRFQIAEKRAPHVGNSTWQISNFREARTAAPSLLNAESSLLTSDS